MDMRFVSASVVVASSAACVVGAPTIVNGDFNGTPGTATAPSGWDIAMSTPDVVNAFGPFNNTGISWTESSNGGTFLRTNGVGNDQSEAISQDVSGFDVGSTYRFDFSVTNLGFQNAASGAWNGFDGFYQFFADGNLIGTSQTVSKQASGADAIVWEAASVEFVALAESFTLEIRGETVGGAFEIAYLGIDGVSVSRVPAPGAAALLGLGGLVATRRRR